MRFRLEYLGPCFATLTKYVIILHFLGFISPGDLAMALLEFLDDNDFETNKAPKQRNIDATGDFERQVF